MSFQDEQRAPIDTCEYIWESGVGFSHPSQQNATHDYNRIEILKLLLTAFSETMYLPPKGIIQNKIFCFIILQNQI